MLKFSVIACATAMLLTTNANAINYNPGQAPSTFGASFGSSYQQAPAAPAAYEAPVAQQYQPMAPAYQQVVPIQQPTQIPVEIPFQQEQEALPPVPTAQQTNIPSYVPQEVPTQKVSTQDLLQLPIPTLAAPKAPILPEVNLAPTQPVTSAYNAPAPSPTRSGVLTIEQALVDAYNTNPQIKAGIAQLEALNENSFQAFSGFLPNISASGSYGGQDSEFGTGRVVDETGSLTYRVSAAQPLFRGGATIFAMDRAENQIFSGRETLKNTEQTILLSTVEAYMNLIRDRGIYEISTLNLQALEKQLQSSKERFELGEITLTDVAQSESRLALAKADKVTAEGQLITSESDFERIIGFTPSSLSKPTNLPGIPQSLQQALDIAMQNNPNIKAAEYNYAAAQDAINENYSGLSPTLSLNGGYEHQEDTLFAGDIDSTTYSVNFNVPLYQAGTEYSNIRRAKKQAENSKQIAINAKRQANANVTRSWKSVETFSSTIVANKAAVEASKIAYEAAQEESVLGTRSVIDVLDSEREYFSAQINLLRAETNYVISIYNLYAQLGILTAKNLNLPTNLYDAEASAVKYQLIGW